MIIQEYGQGTKCGDHQKMYQNVLLPTQQRALVRIDRGPANVRGRQNDVETFFWDEKKIMFPRAFEDISNFPWFFWVFLGNLFHVMSVHENVCALGHCLELVRR